MCRRGKEVFCNVSGKLFMKLNSESTAELDGSEFVLNYNYGQPDVKNWAYCQYCLFMNSSISHKSGIC